MGGIDFAQIFGVSPNPYMVLDRELRYVAANRAYLEVTSARLADLLGRNVFEVFPDSADGAPSPNVQALRASLERVLATGQTDVIALIPYRIPRRLADGTTRDEERFWSATHTPILDERGEVAFILQHTVDVTELQQLKRAASEDRPAPPQLEQGILGRARLVQETNATLAAERELLRSLFEQAPGFVAFLRGPEHVFELINPAYQQLVGHRPVVGKPLREALPEVSGQGFIDLLDRVFRTAQPYVGRGVRLFLQRTPDAPPEECFLDFVYQPILDGAGRAAGIFVQGSDITLQKRAELERAALLASERAERARAELAQREQRFLAEAIPQQVWTARPDGKLDSVNERVLAYFGAERARVLGEGWQEYVHPDDLAGSLAAWNHALKTGESYEVNFRLRRADGSFRWHLGRAVPLRAESGAIVRWYGTNTDVDEARRARDELQERTEFEQQLIGIVSHDLRNPLGAIGVSASLLLRRGNLDDQQGQALGRIVALVGRTGRLIRDFLDFTQARSVGRFPIHPERANLREIARQVVDEVHLSWPEREVSVAHAGDAEGCWDADRIAQVIGNLLANAFQHGPPDAAVRVASRVQGSTAEIEVHNEGPPIPAGDLPRLFTPFQRGDGARNNAGRSVGLGLYISQSIVAAHGGTIEVDSAAGRGTTFTVRLPREARDGAAVQLR